MTYQELKDSYLSDPCAKKFLKDLVRELDKRDPTKLLAELNHVYQMMRVRSSEKLGVDYIC